MATTIKGEVQVALALGLPNLTTAEKLAYTPTAIGSSLATVQSVRVFEASGNECMLAFNRTNKTIESNIAIATALTLEVTGY
jgi:hypothetical protein